MANADFTLTSTEESRAGAMACLEALRTIQNIAEGKVADRSSAGWWHQQDSAVAVMLCAAGNPNGFMAGFIATLAEYVKGELSCVGCYPDDWEKPEAAMTAEEKKASRVKFDEEVAEGGRKIEATKEDKEQAYQEAAAQARESIGVMFTRAEDFRNGCARYVSKIARALVAPEGGYSFEEKTAEKIDQSITALGEIIRDGDVVFSQAQRMRIMGSIVDKAFERQHWFSEAEMEANIQQFMVELLAATSDAAPSLCTAADQPAQARVFAGSF